MPASTVKKLFLDDVRNPPFPGWEWDIVRSYDAFVKYIQENGVPEVISFDHDLAFEHYPLSEENPQPAIPYDRYQERTGYHCVKWLLENGYELKEWYVHSMNPVGAENIRQLILGWAATKKRLGG